MQQSSNRLFPHRLSTLVLLCNLAWPASADPAEPVAAGDTTPTAQQPAAPEEKINVSGKQLSDTDKRRHESVTRIVFGREEISRFGDSTVAEVLKRLPGVTVSGTPGRRGGEIRMRGLGSGYTQILINGEPAARGFSLDSLSPELIERIEVIRAPVAEFSAQAVAGTINIVLREDAKKRSSEFSLSESITDNHKLQPRLGVQHSDRSGQLSYTLAGTVQHYDQLEAESHLRRLRFDQQGQVDFDQSRDSQRRSRGYSLHLAPRLAWRYGEGDTLNLQLLAMHAQDVDRGVYRQAQVLGPVSYDHAEARSDNRSNMLRGTLSRQTPLAGGGKLNLKVGFNGHRMNNDEQRLEQLQGQTRRAIVERSSTREHGFSTGGKWNTALLAENHSLVLGYDADWSRRSEVQTQMGLRDSRNPDSTSNTAASTLRLAGFAQDEWEIDPKWSVYGGLRWESIQTRSSGADYRQENRSSVWSPSLQTVWRLPGTKRDQLRVSLARSYKSPRGGNLLGRTVFSSDNDEFNPDRRGNPELKPELAWGLEMAVEHYLSQNGLISANLFTRRIDNLVRSITSQQADGRWLSQPYNLDRAVSHGLELEAKFRLAELMDDAPPLDVRANLSRYWSRVDGIPGPDNRLDGQQKYSVNLGLDYRFKAVPLTLGGNLNWVPGYSVQSSASERRREPGRRVGDIYALWKFSPAVQLRLAGSNLAHADLTSTVESNRNGLRSNDRSTSRSWTNWTATLELKY
ncbi:TonB-dependent receptor [Chitinimonas arctica]|uniref:TonB-dependent receptor n=1 Tax=Chitinimonas arctica TaxID=2594795 RepID=A0A516SDD2_9NEIS|nr:TonB-dependent receptor [Chitinimonas arctica]QDQ26162.1 TonB-dependent receptor [Chitinimonas arctica]